MHQLNFPKSKFEWTSEAQKALERLKDLYTFASILTLPDHNCQFIVEVDASEMGVGAVFS